MLYLLRKTKTVDFLLDSYVLIMLGLGAAINGLLFYYLKTHIDFNNAFAVLHYTASFGADLIGEAPQIFDFYYEALLLSFLNILLARSVYNYDILSSYILISAVPLLNTLMFFNGFLIASVNSI